MISQQADIPPCALRGTVLGSSCKRRLIPGCIIEKPGCLSNYASGPQARGCMNSIHSRSFHSACPGNNFTKDTILQNSIFLQKIQL